MSLDNLAINLGLFEGIKYFGKHLTYLHLLLYHTKVVPNNFTLSSGYVMSGRKKFGTAALLFLERSITFRGEYCESHCEAYCESSCEAYSSRLAKRTASRLANRPMIENEVLKDHGTILDTCEILL